LIKSIILTAIILTLNLATPVTAAESDGTISGQVVNGTPDGIVPVNLDIALETYISNTEPQVAPGQADAQGNFIFKGLNTNPTYTYQVVVSYLGIEYRSQPVVFTEGETARMTETSIYEKTESDEAISIALSHTIMYAEAQELLVTELFIFGNTGNLTYTGSEEVLDSIKMTVRLPIPREAADIQLDPELMDYVVFTDNGLAFTAPILPGYTQVTYSYRLANSSKDYTFNRTIAYTQSIYELLVQGAEQVDSEQLDREEQLVIEGIAYEYLTSESFPGGQVMVIKLSGLPQNTSQQTILWLLITLLVLGSVFVFMLRRGGRRPVVAGDNRLEQQRILAKIARLDDEFEGGDIPKEMYRQQRSELKSRLLELMQESKTSGRGGA
jgi:hypothetical protein